MVVWLVAIFEWVSGIPEIKFTVYNVYLHFIKCINCSPHLTRVDTFDPHPHLIDITLKIPGISFNASDKQARFLTKLRLLMAPQFPKVSSVTLDKDK